MEQDTKSQEDGMWLELVVMLIFALFFGGIVYVTNNAEIHSPPTPTPVCCYDIDMRILAPPVVYKELQGRGGGFLGGGGTSGGGLIVGSEETRLEEKRTLVLRGEVLSISPTHPVITGTQQIILLTQDVRVLALPAGARVTIRCTNLGEGELGKCRMASALYTPPPPSSDGE